MDDQIDNVIGIALKVHELAVHDVLDGAPHVNRVAGHGREFANARASADLLRRIGVRPRVVRSQFGPSGQCRSDLPRRVNESVDNVFGIDAHGVALQRGVAATQDQLPGPENRALDPAELGGHVGDVAEEYLLRQGLAAAVVAIPESPPIEQVLSLRLLGGRIVASTVRFCPSPPHFSPRTNVQA